MGDIHSDYKGQVAYGETEKTVERHSKKMEKKKQQQTKNKHVCTGKLENGK